MQVPTTLEGLRKVLRSLGYGDVVAGLDGEDPEAKQHLMQQIAWKWEQSAQNMQDNARRKKALSYIERFPWGDTEMSDGMLGLHSSVSTVLTAIEDVQALLDEEMVLEPVDVEYIDEDEDEEIETILIRRASRVHAKLSDWRGDWLHFTKKPYIKLNPKPLHGDPVGIYLFPESFDPETPFWSRMGYKFVVKLKPSAKVLDLAKLSGKEALVLARKLVGGEPHRADQFLTPGPDRWESPGNRLWEALRQHFGRKQASWNTALQRAGYDAVFDDTRAIHIAEVQLIVLNPKVIEVLHREDLKTGSGFAEVKLVSKQLAKALKHLGRVTVTEPRMETINWGEKGLQAQVRVEDGDRYAHFKVNGHKEDLLVRVSLAYSSPRKDYGVGADYDMYKKKWLDRRGESGLDSLVEEAESLFARDEKLAARMSIAADKMSRRATELRARARRVHEREQVVAALRTAADLLDPP